jgi:apolipoprotein D and lipocalin family protein
MKRMNLVSFLVAVFVLAPSAFAVETVSHVDIKRYMGSWFEISSIPARFQRHCVKNVTAEYKLLETGKVDVINSCDQANGKRQVGNGLAEVKNKKTNAELGVSFVPLFNHFGWFQGQYKILSLGENYDYVLVGEDSLRFGWILARKPQLSLDTLAELEKEIRRQGYDSCQFLTSLQDGGAFKARQPLCEVIKQ